MKLFTIGNVVNDVTICIGFNIPALKDEAIHMRNLSYVYQVGNTVYAVSGIYAEDGINVGCGEAQKI